jgi:hypothetical protein
MLKRTLTPQVPCQHWPVINITPPCDPAQILRPSPRPPWVHDQPGITPHSSHSSTVMNRSASLLAALALTSSAALNLSTAGNASAMTIAWECFDRTSQALVARSAVDLTSAAISCLQAAGEGSAASPDPAADLATEPAVDPSFSQDPTNDDTITPEQGASDPSLATASSTGDALGQAFGSHLGKLIGQGFADLFGR